MAFRFDVSSDSRTFPPTALPRPSQGHLYVIGFQSCLSGVTRKPAHTWESCDIYCLLKVGTNRQWICDTFETFLDLAVTTARIPALGERRGQETCSCRNANVEVEKASVDVAEDARLEASEKARAKAARISGRQLLGSAIQRRGQRISLPTATSLPTSPRLHE